MHRFLLPITRGVAVGVALGVGLASATLSAQSRTPIRTLEIGARAPDFKLPAVDGKTYTLKSFEKAKVLVVVFTCNHCPTACAYEERIKKLVNDTKKKGVAFVAISPSDPLSVRLNELGWTDLGDTFAEMKIRARHKKFNFPYLYDGEHQKASKAYGPRATPHVFVFDAERKLRYAGRFDNSESGRKITQRDVQAAVDALLAGKPVPVETTRPMGCSIKWASKRGAVKAYMEKLAAEKVSLESIDVERAKALRANQSQKHRLINVWATYCAPCVKELPDLVTIHRMYRRREFEMVTLSVDSGAKRDAALALLTKTQASSRNVIFEAEDREPLAKALDEKWSGALPLTLLVAPGGKIVYRREGEIDVLELRRTIVKHLPPWR